MRINKDKIVELVNGYEDCTLEEIIQSVDGNYCCITSDYTKKEDPDGEHYWVSGVLNLVEELRKFENINHLKNETYPISEENDGFYECVTFEWGD